jgi:hypothetical protein
VKHGIWILTLIGTLACTGCASESGPTHEQDPVETPAEESPLDPEDPTVLRRPFSAEQIRNEWIVGLTLDIAITGSDGVSLQRWTVLEVDDLGAQIEYAVLDREGQPVGEPLVERTGWVELRNHATFPAEHSERQTVRRTTPLGDLDGWLYTVRNPEVGTTTEFFFASSLPGAPIQVVTTQGGEIVGELKQLARRRPE